MSSKFWITRICLKTMTSYWWTWTCSRQSYIHRRKANHDLACILSSMKSGEKLKEIDTSSKIWVSLQQVVSDLKMCGSWSGGNQQFDSRPLIAQLHNNRTIVQQLYNNHTIAQRYNNHTTTIIFFAQCQRQTNWLHHHSPRSSPSSYLHVSDKQILSILPFQ